MLIICVFQLQNLSKNHINFMILTLKQFIFTISSLILKFFPNLCIARISKSFEER